MTRNGKIARLPQTIREQINRRLLNGDEGKQIAEWLNTLPEVQALMAAEFDGQSEVFIASPDWMPRNFFRRIEAVFPVEDSQLRDRVRNEVLETCLQDNVKAWHLQADGTYARRHCPSAPARRSQVEFMALAFANRPD